MVWYGMVRYGMVQYGMVCWRAPQQGVYLGVNTVLRCYNEIQGMVCYCVVWYGMVQYGMIRMLHCGMVWYSMVRFGLLQSMLYNEVYT